MNETNEGMASEDLHNDVVDWDVNKLDKEANEAHDGESDCCGKGNFLKLCLKIKYNYLNFSPSFFY